MKTFTQYAAVAFLAGAAIFAPMATSQAEAKSDVSFGIYFGTPHYRYAPGPGYVMRPGYGWYKPGYGNRSRLSCVQAKNELRADGYRIRQTIECNGRNYTFRTSKNGVNRTIVFDARTGRYWRA
jgi:hypothetical protein